MTPIDMTLYEVVLELVGEGKAPLPPPTKEDHWYLAEIFPFGGSIGMCAVWTRAKEARP